MQSMAARVFRGTRAILKYKKERDILLNNIRRYIVTLRSVPEGNYLIEVALNIHSLKIQADKLLWASEALANDAPSMSFVTSKGTRFYLSAVPQACAEIGSRTRLLSSLLMDHIHKPVVNTEHVVALDLEYALADMEARLG